MIECRYLLDDGTEGTVEQPDFDAACAKVTDLAGVRGVVLVQRVVEPAPTVVRAVSGADVVLDVAEGGTVVATPVEP